MQRKLCRAVAHFHGHRRLDAGFQEILQLFVLGPAGNFCHAFHFQRSAPCDLCNDFGRNLKAAALKIHIL